MVLAMTRPERHPKTGIFQFRKRVPQALRAVLGKTEEKVSLRTRDPAEAKIAHARVAAEVEAKWRQLAEGAQSLSHRQIESIAGEIYRQMMDAHGDDPDQVPRGLAALIMDRAVLRPGSARISLAGANKEKSQALLQLVKTRRNAKAIDEWLERRGLLLTPESREKLGTAVDRAILQAREQLHRMSGGDYRPDPEEGRFPPLDVPKPGAPSKARSKSKTSPVAIFDAYATEAALKPRTIKRWRPIYEDMAKGLPDMTEISRQWVIQWKDDLMARNLSARTVREVYLASLKAVCAWAYMNDRIKSNPTTELTIKVKKAPRLRTSGFTDAEAQLILAASLGPQPGGLSAHYRAARRWVPWLCALTGARVGEIAQLRKEDVQDRDGIPMIWITPEAGTVKTDSARCVPLHPELIRQGFIEWAAARKGGTLFLDQRSHRGGTTPPAERVGQHLAKWVREIGVDDPRVQPNHGWRHRFATLARDHDLRGDATRYLQGHAPHATDEAYGDHNMAPLLRELKKLPAIMRVEAE